ncbi:MAG: metallophosphoesterase [Bacteroidota bacterium]
MKRIKKIFVSAIIATFIISFSSIRIDARSSISKLADDHFEIVLENLDSDSIRILQVTDLHLGSTGHWRDDLRTYNRIKRLVKMYDPHFIFITGDLFTGEKPYGSLLAAYAVHFFDELERPWFYVYGNHDPEGGFGHDDIYEVFSTSEWGILGYHGSEDEKKYDYYVDIKVDDGDAPNWQVYALDTGPHNGIKAAQPDQIEWYKNISKQTKEKYSTTIRSVSIFHIPLIQYKWLWEDDSIEKSGVSLEKVYYEEDDGSLYKAFIEMGNIQATFCGHDHYNNYWGKYTGGIILAYGYISGESTNEAWPTGGKLITLPIGKGDIGIRNVIPIFDKDEHQY